MPIDLQGVYLASGTSGKGLQSYPGLSMVFYNHEIMAKSENIPRYLDLGIYASSKGIPFTVSSNLVYSLKKALGNLYIKDRYNKIVKLSCYLKAKLKESGFQIVAPEQHSAPALITIDLPDYINSEQLGRRLDEAGFYLSYRSEYLLERNWIQISLMGQCTYEIIDVLLDLLNKLYFSIRRAR